MMRRQRIDDIALGLRRSYTPMDWFEDPNNGCNCPPDWYEWSHLVLPGASNAAPYQGQRTAAIQSDKRHGLMLFLDTVAGVNQVYEVVKAWTIFPYSNNPALNPGGSFAQPWFWSMGFNRSNAAGTDAGEKYQGISFGSSWNINTPWQTGYAGAPHLGGSGEVRVGLHYNYTTNKWQVQIASLFDPDALDGAPQLIDCAIQPPFVVDSAPAEVSLLWVPRDRTGRNSRLVAMHNGTMILDLLDNPRCNQFQDSSSAYGPGYYFTHGSGASSRASEAGYFTGRLWAPVPRYT